MTLLLVQTYLGQVIMPMTEIIKYFKAIHCPNIFLNFTTDIIGERYTLVRIDVQNQSHGLEFLFREEWSDQILKFSLQAFDTLCSANFQEDVFVVTIFNPSYGRILRAQYISDW